MRVKPPKNHLTPHQVHRMLDRLSYARETNYGKIFHVKANFHNPNNQAYTSQSLPFHTDLPFYRLAPDIQILHCVGQAGKPFVKFD
jgi:hypothetical protein